MVNLNYAYTAPINPPNATPVLTEAQVWAGLQRKIRNAHEFVSLIKTCNVISDGGEDGEVVREITLGANSRPGPGKVREVVQSYKPLKVDFLQPEGGLVSNIISGGPSQKPEDLMMTYTFQWVNRPGEPGSEEAKEILAKGKADAKAAVEGSIDTIRRFVQEGKL